jgi:hypothetical protein
MPATIRTNCSSSGLELVRFNRLDEAKPTATRRLTTRHRMPSGWRMFVGAEEGSDAVRSDRHRNAPAPAVDTLKRRGFRSWARAQSPSMGSKGGRYCPFCCRQGLSSPVLPRLGSQSPAPSTRRLRVGPGGLREPLTDAISRNRYRLLTSAASPLVGTTSHTATESGGRLPARRPHRPLLSPRSHIGAVGAPLTARSARIGPRGKERPSPSSRHTTSTLPCVA